MGFRISHLASRMAPQEMADALGLAVSGTAAEMPQPGWWAARIAASGWTLLWAEDEDFGTRAPARAALAALSERADVLRCQVNETVMWSSAALWSGGRPVWTLAHAGDAGDVFDLRIEGTPPEEFAAIRDRQIALQRTDDGEVDHIFDVPLLVARVVTGFKHDEAVRPGDFGRFHLIVPPSRPGLLARLFRR